LSLKKTKNCKQDLKLETTTTILPCEAFFFNFKLDFKKSKKIETAKEAFKKKKEQQATVHFFFDESQT